MRARTASRLVWIVWGLTLGLVVATLTLTSLNRSHPGGDVRAQSLASVVVLVYATVGAFLVRRRQSAIGWILIGIALGTTVGFLAEQYSLRGLIIAPGSLPAATIMAWLQLPGLLAYIAFALLFLLFPDGRPPGPRWRLVLWLWVAGLTLAGLGLLLRPGPLETRFGGDVLNPMGIEALEAPLEAALWLGSGCLGLAVLGSVAALIVRFHRARGDERQQLKWVAYVGATATVFLIATFASDIGATVEGERPISDAFFIAFFSTLVLGLPLALSVSILKYRLYDIDRIINRTLVYGSVTALLAGIYVGAVIGLGTLVRSLGGQENNPLVIAASTLAVAAAFGPARRRIQGFIDRRFYRRKYNVARTLEAFSARLREQVDLDSLSGELVGLVRDTMQPSHVSLWLRRPETKG